MIENKKSCCYGYGKPETQTLIKLVKITGIQNVYTEIICAKNTSGLCQEMQESNGRYGLYQEQVSDIYTNFLWVDCLAEYNESILDKVIESEPEIIIFYFSDQPIISSIDIDAFSYTKCMDNYVWECVFEIGLDENYFCASFNSERFLAKKFISELERVIM